MEKLILREEVVKMISQKQLFSKEVDMLSVIEIKEN
jgi:hypothetical protein